MGLAIFLRKRQTPNQFRNLLISSIDTGLGDSALLCSGFFQENFKNGTYQVSDEGNFLLALKRNKIKLTTVGVHNPSWLQPYKNFRDNLRKEKIDISAKLTWNYHWHAKIFILKKNGEPIFGIIGSSNMTRNAFGETAPFNYEADVVLWVDKYKKLKKLLTTTVSELNQFNSEVIVADYNPENNFGLTIEERLQQISDDVEKADLKDLE